MRAVLVGNQNCGKSTIFNILTGSNQKIGNWPGVTVSKKSGLIDKLEMEVVDLPGIYSLVPYTLEEKITQGFLLNEEYDLIINVVDATSLERGLFLTTQLCGLNKKVIVILNMMDKLKKKGIIINIEKLKERLHVDVCEISAAQGIGIIGLIKTIKKVMKRKNNNRIKKNSINVFKSESDVILRYKYIDRICNESIRKKTKRKNIGEYIDKIVLNKYLAIPIFILIMFVMYYISIDVFGNVFSEQINNSLIIISNYIIEMLERFNTSDWIISLICDGIIVGVGSVLSYLPQLVIIFLCTSFLEISGYMARVAFIFDMILKKIGLNGKSLISYILGIGCSVSGIISSKIIEEKSERINTIITNSFVPCSAKLPIIVMFSKSFFESNYALIATSFYFLSIIIIIISAKIISKLINKSKEELYIFELPEYRFPKFKFLYKDTKEKIFDFISKAGTTIFLSSIIVWILLSFSTSFKYGVSIEDSILAFCGKKISIIFKPFIGVRSWEVSISALQGIIAKEQVVSSIRIINSLSTKSLVHNQLFNKEGIFGFFNKASSYAFVSYNLFTTPCIVAIISMYKELNNIKYFLLAIIYQFLIGWSVAFVAYRIISLFI